MKACENCLYSEVVAWEQDPKSGKATPIYWCEKHYISCEDILACDDLDTGESEE